MSMFNSQSRFSEQFDMIMSEIPDITRRRLFGCQCYWANGYIFTGIDSTGWFVRLSPEDREAIKKKYNAKHFDPLGGKPMREYIMLPEEVLEDQELIDHYLEQSLAFVRAMPPKEK